MSSRRLDSTIATEDEVKDLILELQALLSTEVDRSRTTKVGKLTLCISIHDKICYIGIAQPHFFLFG